VKWLNNSDLKVRKHWLDILEEILKNNKEEVVAFCDHLQFPGGVQKATLVKLLFWFPGEMAKKSK